MGSWKGRGNQYIQFVRVLYCKLPTNGKQLPAFPLEAVPGIKPWPQRWEARVLPLCHHGPCKDLDGLRLIFMVLQLMLLVLYTILLSFMQKQGKKGFRSTSVSHKAIRYTSSALRHSPLSHQSSMYT